MKNEDFQRSLLSAWFDGEATEEEAAAAEWLIAESDVARREIAEYARLSAWLCELPAGVSVSSVLSSSVPGSGERSARAEGNGKPDRRAVSGRASLVPRTVGVEAVAISDLGRSRGSWSARCAVFVAAAVLVLCVGLLPRPGDRHAPRLAEADPPDRQPLVAANFDPPATEAQTAFAFEGHSPAVAGALPSAAIADRRDREFAPGADLRQAIRRDVAPSRFFDGPPEVGEVLRLVAESDDLDDLEVVEVTVVDVQRAAGVLEVLLARNSIPQMVDERTAQRDVVAEPDSAARPRDDFGGRIAPGIRRRNFPDEAELTVVYVEASEPQLAAVLSEMAREPLVVAVYRDQAHETDQRAASSIDAPAGGLGRTQSSLPGAVGPESKLLAGSAAARHRLDDVAGATAEGRGTAVAHADKAATNAYAKQIRFELPESSAQKFITDQRSRKVDSRAQPKDGLHKAGAAPAGRLEAEAGSEATPPDQSRVRMLFMLRPAEIRGRRGTPG